MAVGERCLVNQEQIMQQLQAGMQAYQGQNLDGAEAIFKQILALNPKEPNALHLLGCIYKDLGQLQRAAELIQESIREDDSNPIPFLWLLLMMFHFQQNNQIMFRFPVLIT